MYFIPSLYSGRAPADFDNWFNEPVLYGTYDFSKGLLWNDSISGLVAAKLVNNPAYETLYKIWLEKLAAAKMKRPRLEKWKKLISI